MKTLTQEEMLSALAVVDAEALPFQGADRVAVTLPAQKVATFCQVIKNHPQLQFDLLLTHTAVHWPNAGAVNEAGLPTGELELLYQLYSTVNQHYLLISTRVPVSNPVIPSVAAVWQIAEWQEREVYDLFGVLYQNHPDLRRLFLEDDWSGFPLRKDYVDDFMLKQIGSGK